MAGDGREQDTRFMERALQQARTAVAAGQTPFGALVVDAQARTRAPLERSA